MLFPAPGGRQQDHWYLFTKDDEVFSAYLSCVTSLGDCMNDCGCHGDRAGCLKGSHEEMERDEQEQIIVKRAEQP